MDCLGRKVASGNHLTDNGGIGIISLKIDKGGYNMAVASLVLGIISIVIGLFVSGYGWLGAIVALVGIILGASARKKQDDKVKIATAGLVCSIIGLVLCVIFYIACVACIGSLAATLPDMMG